MSLASFEQLIFHLSEALDTELHLDEHNICTLLINDLFTVQLELDSREELLIMGCFLTILAPGSYRSKTFKAILNANEGFHSKEGILSFVPKNNMLFIHKKYPINHLDGPTLLEMLMNMVIKGSEWKEAIEKGKIAPSSIAIPQNERGKGHFEPGIKT